VSYADEAVHSADPRRTYLCLAGLVAKEESWKDFDQEWRTACAEEHVALPFHMMDFAAFGKQFHAWSEEQRKRLLKKLVAAIRHASAVPVGSVVSVKDYNAFSPSLKAKLKDPYFMALQPLTWNLAVAAILEMPTGPVSMVFAHHPEHSSGRGNSEELWKAFRRNNPTVGHFMESYATMEPKDCTPLQAADLWAYELGHHFEVIRPAGMEARWPFKQFVEMGLKNHFTHDFITLHDRGGLNGLGRYSQVARGTQLSLDRSTAES
jgi:hypothetical protein